MNTYGRGILEIYQLYKKKKAKKLVEYGVDKEDDIICRVGSSVALLVSSNVGSNKDIPGMIAGGPYCNEIYVLGNE